MKKLVSKNSDMRLTPIELRTIKGTFERMIEKNCNETREGNLMVWMNIITKCEKELLKRKSNNSR